MSSIRPLVCFVNRRVSIYLSDVFLTQASEASHGSDHFLAFNQLDDETVVNVVDGTVHAHRHCFFILVVEVKDLVWVTHLMQVL